MSLAIGGAVALAFVAALAIVLLVTTYNGVVRMRRGAERAWANIDVALKQRWDELPNLVAAVRGQLGFERQVLDEVTRLRAAYSPTAPLRTQAAIAAATTAALRSLFAVVEAYPQLRSQENVLALQAEIERLETVIAQRRELFNEGVYQYNATIAQLPAVLVAPLFGWNALPMFDAIPDERSAPGVALLDRA